MIKLVVFDWNGTLFADTVATLDSVNYGFSKFGGKPPISMKAYRDTITTPVADFYVKHGFERDAVLTQLTAINRVFHDSYERRVSKTRTRKGAKKLLAWLKKNGVKTIILSNHTVSGIKLMLDKLGLARLVSEILANSDIDTALKQRNKLEKLRGYLSAGGYGKSEVLIVGDSLEEVEIGRQLGVTSVAITDGYCSTKRLKAASPDFLINSLESLAGVIKSNGFLAGKKRN